MGPADPSTTGTEQQRRSLQTVLARKGITLPSVWLRYFSLGGEAGELEIEAFVQGVIDLPPMQRDMLAQAANERLEELAGTLRVPYSREMSTPLSAGGPLPALVGLLRGTPRALAGAIGDVASQAAAAMGRAVEVHVYVVDYEQGHLVPLPGTRAGPTRPLPVEGTLAGRAFQTGRTVAGAPDEDFLTRLWVPMIDSIERIGVLEVVAGQPEAGDPVFREQLGWFAALLAHIVESAAEHGDVVDAARRTAPRVASAELVWALLPPLTAGTESFTVSGLLEPADRVGGDMFDYALSESSVQLAVFDAMGHALSSGLVSAAAVAAYRAARRSGGALAAQAAAIDRAIADNFGDTFATGVLAELDLTSGRLRYVAAGHPEPLLMRDGKVVHSLDGGRRLPFGLGDGEVEVGETSLQPGDWLVLHTDGVTEARGPDGALFGLHRLVDLLEREAAAALDPPETVRRLIAAVMRHQHGVLQDDATVLLARWAPPPPTPAPPD